MKLLIKSSILPIAVLLILSCNSKMPEEAKTDEVQSTVVSATQLAEPNSPQPHQYKRGDHVPNELVCMVNNAFMNKKQIEIQYKGKTYYGCCEGCVGRIKTDETARTAIDPETGAKVDKAKAYIVLIGESGEVAYFTSKKSYEHLLARSGKG